MIFNRGCNKHTMISINKRKSFCPENRVVRNFYWLDMEAHSTFQINCNTSSMYTKISFIMRLFFLRYNHIFFSSLFFIHNFNTVIIWWDIRYPVFLLTLKVFMWNNIYYMQSICIIYCTSNWYIFSCSSLICHGFTKLPSYNVSMLVLSQLGFSS